VQIWFQNRRQRLLKPLRQAERQDGNHGDRSPSSSGTASTAGLSGCDASSDSGDGSSETMRCDSTSSTEGGDDGQHPYPVMAAQLANMFAPLLRADGSAHNAAAAATVQAALARLGAMAGGDDGMARLAGAVPLDSQGLPPAAAALLAQAIGQIPGGPNTVFKAMAAVGRNGDLHSPSAAALLAHALQQQQALVSASGNLRPSPLVLSAPDTSQHSSPAVRNRTSILDSTPALISHVYRFNQDGSPTLAISQCSQEGVDGLLLLSACADVQRRASPSTTPAPSTATAPTPAASENTSSVSAEASSPPLELEHEQKQEPASVPATAEEAPETAAGGTKEELPDESPTSRADECEPNRSNASPAETEQAAEAADAARAASTEAQSESCPLPSQVPPLVSIEAAGDSSDSAAKLEANCDVPQSPGSPVAQHAAMVTA
tara:strand:+ start:2140 stop:3441 length:1302 start_codon:yes stop_codon:yes gene_type:complete